MDSGERPDPARVAALRAAILRAEQGQGIPDDARELAGLARWLWEQFAEPLSARDAALYHATNRCLFEPPTEEEAAADALLRKRQNRRGPREAPSSRTRPVGEGSLRSGLRFGVRAALDGVGPLTRGCPR
jgi:hypothetical protein